MKIILSLLLIALPSVCFAAEKQILSNFPSTTHKIIFNPSSKDPKDERNRVSTGNEIRKQYLDQLDANLRERLPERAYFGLATVGHAGFQTFNYFNSEAKATVKFNDTRLTLRSGRGKPAKFEISREFNLDNSRFESGSFSGYISQQGNVHVGFRFKF